MSDVELVDVSTLRTLDALVEIADQAKRSGFIENSVINELDPIPADLRPKIKRGYIVYIDNADFDSVKIRHKAFAVPNTDGWNLKEMLRHVHRLINQNTTGDPDPGAPGHDMRYARTKFHMNLTAQKEEDRSAAFLVFHCSNPNHRFSKRGQSNPAVGAEAPFALTGKVPSSSGGLLMPVFADGSRQTIVTLCQPLAEGTEFDYNIALNIRDRCSNLYDTPIIIDPKVRNDG